MTESVTPTLEPFIVALDPASERVRKIVEPAIDAAGCELVLLKVRRQARTATVQIFADRQGEETIGIDDLQKLNRELGDLLDVEDAHEGLFPGTWDLEVSSPGIDRPLTKKSHFTAAKGAKVKIKGRALGGARVTVRGVLTDVSETAIAVLDGDGQSKSFTYDEVGDAHTIFEFEAQPKPSPKRKKKGAKAHDAGDDEDAASPV